MFLELNGTNLTSIMSFDSRSMQSLLNPKHSNLFSEEYPIFYKNKLEKGRADDIKFYYQNAIDTAIANDQTRSIEKIIEYLVKY
jgi:hypothetical protein